MKINLGIKKIRYSNMFEYFYYFFIMALSVIVLLGGVLYFYFSSVLTKEAIKTNNTMLLQLKNAQEVILKEVDNSIVEIVFDSFINKYMDYYNTNDYVMLMSIQEKIEKTISLNDYIDSIFIYFLNEKVVLSSDQGTESINTFYDNEFLLNIKYSDLNGNEVYSRIKKEFNSKNNMNTLSFVKAIPLNYVGKPKAIVVFNIKGYYLQSLINSIKTNPLANMIITDQNGKIISKNNDGSGIQGFGSINDFDVKKLGKTGYTISNISNKRSLISYIYSEKYKWNYIYTIPLSSVKSSISTLGLVVGIFTILMILLSIAGSIILSKRLYSPIQSIVNLIRKNEDMFSTHDECNINQKETKLIEKNITGLIDKNKTLYEKNQSLHASLKDYEIYQKNVFYQNLLEGNSDIGKKFFDEMNYYEVELDTDGYFCAFVISMDKYSEFLQEYSIIQKNLLFTYIRDNIGNAIFDKYKGFIVEMNSNETVIIVNFTDLNKLMNIKNSLAKEVHSLVSEGFKYTFTIGISRIKSGIGEVHKCFKEAVFALNHRLIIGYNNIINYDDIADKVENKFTYPFNIEKKILNSFIAGERRGVKDALDDFTKFIYDNPSDNIDFVRHFFLQLLSSSSKILNEIGRGLDVEHYSFKEIYLNILKEETLEAMVSHLSKFYESIIKYSEEQRESKNNEMIEEVKKYIIQKLGQDLSIERVAEKFNISSSYLRKLFKDETSITLKEYIDEMRMEKAKELLKDPSCKIQTIAENVGYISVSAFTRAFRLETGMTPGEYRKM